MPQFQSDNFSTSRSAKLVFIEFLINVTATISAHILAPYVSWQTTCNVPPLCMLEPISWTIFLLYVFFYFSIALLNFIQKGVTSRLKWQCCMFLVFYFSVEVSTQLSKFCCLISYYLYATCMHECITLLEAYTHQ